MTKVVFHRVDSIIKYNRGRETEQEERCEYEFDPGAWEETHDNDAQLYDQELNEGNVWRCPHKRKEGHSKCIFHLPVDKKNDDEVLESLVEEIEQPSGKSETPTYRKQTLQLIGARFGEFDIGKIDILDENTDTLDLRHAHISGEIQWKDVSFHPSLLFDGANFESSLMFDGVDFTSNVSFSNACFETSSDDVLSFHDCVFYENINFSNTTVEPTAYFTQSEFLEKADFSDWTIQQGASFQMSKFRGETSFSSSTVTGGLDKWPENWGMNFWKAHFDGELRFPHSTFEHPLNFKSTTCSEGVNLINVEFLSFGDFSEMVSYGEVDISRSTLSEGLRFQSATISGPIEITNIDLHDSHCNIDFENAELSSGSLHQPSQGYIMYLFNEAEVGDIDLKPGTSTSFSLLDRLTGGLSSESSTDLLQYYYFLNTGFNGLDFSRYHRELEETGWVLHTMSGREFDNLRYRLEVDPSDDKEHDGPEVLSFSIDMSNPDILGSTYLKAKNGAQKVGDSKSASEFFIREMKYRKKRHKQEFKVATSGLISTFPYVSDEKSSNPKNPLKPGYRWFVNSFLEFTSGYGERLGVVVLYSLLTIINFGLIFPLAGGITNGEDRLSLSVVGSNSHNLVEVLWQNLYFSLVTFTTLGNNYRPVGPIAQILTGIESLLGSFLLALLVFSLGRKVTR
ncbi:pentapeptide repeat-containing protein [Natrinema salinisoli]|uniref:pentapeptide repeat-containing protein n=1 Tax=Natrinema salinisoli TaxID=2878535 RepID=UPI001CF05F45|nr:pentapeptide repeat-containing protein [Natrinema salinisoli]